MCYIINNFILLEEQIIIPELVKYKIYIVRENNLIKPAKINILDEQPVTFF